MRRSLALALAVSAVALGACGGPKEPFDVGTQAAPVDLILGELEEVIEAPVGPMSLELPSSFSRFVPIGSPPPAPPEPVEPCPDFDPLAPITPGDIEVSGRPQNGTYPYRAKTTETVGNMRSSFTGDSKWDVKAGPVNPETGEYDVTIDVSIGTSKSTRVLRVLPKPITGQGTPAGDPNTTDLNFQVIDQYNATAPLLGLERLPRNAPNLGRYGFAGIYLVSQTSGDDTFTPNTPIPLLQTPVSSRSFTGIGTDGKTVMSFLSTVNKTAFVNACGKKVETIQVDLTDGRVAGTDSDGQVYRVGFTESLFFGMQYGGIPVQDMGTVKLETVGDTDTVERSFEFTANTEPKPAQRG
jgi:hypothetical protein